MSGGAEGLGEGLGEVELEGLIDDEKLGLGLCASGGRSGIFDDI